MQPQAALERHVKSGISVVDVFLFGSTACRESISSADLTRAEDYRPPH
jgi:hypothetical protein